jgi:methyl-accepting chemotaxis protein
MMNLSLRTKMLFVVGLTIFIALATSALINVHVLNQEYLASIKGDSEALVQSIVNEILDKYQLPTTSQKIPLKEVLAGTSVQCMRLYESRKEKNITHIAVIDAFGMIVAHNDRALWETPLKDPFLRTQIERREQMIVPIGPIYHTLIPIFGGEDLYLGTIDVGVLKKVADEKIRQIFLNTTALFGLFGFLAFLITSAFFQVMVITPIRYLVTVAEKIARGELVHIAQSVSGETRASYSNLKTSCEIRALIGALHNVLIYFQDLAHAASRIAVGDLSQAIAARSDNDVLSSAFQRMSRYLNQIASAATAIADGDLRQEVQPIDEHDALGTAFQKMASLHHAIRRLRDEASHVKGASVSLSEISMLISSEAEHNSQRVQVVSLSSQQVSENILSVSGSTREVSESICEISRSMNDVTSVMSNAVIFANSANVAIADLEARSQEIGNIIKVITAITQQTNLLALNATIEAARAGESGKGFKVVANEVKTLAEEIATFAEDITHKVETMQSSSRSATKTLAEIAETICKTDEFFGLILATTEQQKSMALEIARNIAGTSKGSGQVTEGIADVAATTQHTIEQAAKLQHTSEELALLADQLQLLLSPFKI